MSIELRDVRCSYGSIAALNGLTMDIKPGSFVCILGANGSGKSTLAKLMNALVPPDGGSVTVDGCEDALYMRRKVALVFQNPKTQIVEDTVEDDVAFGPCNMGLDAKEISERVDWSLKLLGLEALRKKDPNMLSGGQQQCTAIAGALAMMPSYLVLDEATSMLDEQGCGAVLNAIKAIMGKCNTSVVMMTHRPEEALLADHVYVLGEGTLKRHGAPAGILSDVAFLHSLGLGSTVAAELAFKLRNDGLTLKGNIVTENDLINAIGGDTGC